FKAVVEGGDGSLRVKLFVDRSGPELHRLRWELLTDPLTGVPLATSERIVFSCFGASNDWTPVRIRPKAELRALVAVSNPANLAEYGLAPVDAEGEVGRARDHLQGMGVAVAGRSSSPARLSLRAQAGKLLTTASAVRSARAEIVIAGWNPIDDGITEPSA